MTITKLYGKKLVHSNLSFYEGIAEIGGPENVASLGFVTQGRHNGNGKELSGFVKEGIVVVPANYALNPNLIRAIVRNGFPQTSKKKDRTYLVGRENLVDVVEAIRNGIKIDESKVVGNNCIQLPFDSFGPDNPLSMFLFGGKGESQEIYTETAKAREYFVGASKTGTIDLYLPPLNLLARRYNGEVIVTQIYSWGREYNFCLDGSLGSLSNKGVFGIED